MLEGLPCDNSIHLAAAFQRQSLGRLLLNRPRYRDIAFVEHMSLSDTPTLTTRSEM